MEPDLQESTHTLKPETWVKLYSDTLFHFTYARVGDKETAKDLVQETFLAALRNLDNYKGEISEKNWLFTIIKNKIIDHYRKRSTIILSELEDLFQQSESFFDENDQWKKNSAPKEWNVGYSMPVESDEFNEILNKCIERLNELSRIVFSMKYLDEKESDEICKELSITSSNYWVIIHRAKLQLRSCLEKNWIK